MQDLEPIKKIIASLSTKEPAIMAAYVFGSIVTGMVKTKSDLDVAILLDEKKSERFSILSFITDLEKKTGRRADVVNLNKAGEVLKFEVRRKGILVFERSPEFRKKFEIKGRKSYEDFLYIHKRYTDSVLYGGIDG